MNLLKRSTCAISQTAIALAAVALLAACTAAPSRVEVQRVNVAVPMECQEPVPARPMMPIDSLRIGATVDDFTKAALAEITRREGYELQLLTALESCRRPVGSPAG